MDSTLPQPFRRALAAAALSAAAAGCSDPAPRWNVVLVTLDTTRADALGAYGAQGDPTPFLDALAREGTRFDLAISTSAVTPVSHASILTGRDNAGHGLRVLSAEGGYRLAPGVPTLAGELRERGWQTAAIHSAFPVSAHFGLERGFDVFESFEADLSEGPQGHSWDAATFQRRSDETTDMAVGFLEATGEPFFLWLHYWDPHDTKRLPPEEHLPAGLDVPEGRIPAPSRELYAAEVRYMDRQIGRLMDALREAGLWDRTLIAVVSDHGEGLGDHGWWHHRILYQEQIRVPLILRVPGEKGRSSVGELVRTTDLAPTVLDYLGLPPPQGASGRSLRGLIEGRAEPGRIAFADQINGYDANAKMVQVRPYDDFLYCAMDREWKLVYRPAHPERSELYHLATDPGETRNLYGERQGEAVRLLRELASHAGWVTAPFAPQGGGDDLAGAQAALAALGYTGDGGSGEKAEAKWRWVCPEHTDAELQERGRCPRCGSPPVPVGR